MQKKILTVIITMLISILVVLIAFVMYKVVNNNKSKKGVENILSQTETNNAIITEYIVYGTHLSLKGEIELEFASIKNINLVMCGTDGKEQKSKLDYKEENGKIKFQTSDILNQGIDLEKVPINNWIMLIEVKGNKETKYYSLQNDTEYGEIVYYTITKNGKNNKIDINFDTFDTDVKKLAYMKLDVKNAHLPKNVYDIVIDPGHGGSDTGAKYGGYEEADLTIEYAKKIKKELEKLGLKIKITRDGTEDKENFGTQTVYDEKGRVNIVRRCKSKVCIFNTLK